MASIRAVSVTPSVIQQNLSKKFQTEEQNPLTQACLTLLSSGGYSTHPPEHIYPAVRSYGAANTAALNDFSKIYITVGRMQKKYW